MKKTGSLILACAGLVACADGDLEWGFRVDPSIDGETRGIVAEVRDDGCDGDLAPISVYHRARDGAEEYATPTLPAGRYSFVVTALDAECRPIGRGCAEVDLPDDARVEVEIEPSATGPVVCDLGATCADGVCATGDAGP